MHAGVVSRALGSQTCHLWVVAACLGFGTAPRGSRSEGTLGLMGTQRDPMSRWKMSITAAFAAAQLLFAPQGLNLKRLFSKQI